MRGSCWREQGGSTGSVCVRDIAAGKGSMSSMRPGEILGLYVMSLQRPPSPQGHHDACAGLAALFPTTAAPGFH